MELADILVLTGGTGLIIFILWFFFGPRKAQEVAVAPRGKEGRSVQAVTIVVEAAYLPNEVVVKKGVPVEITFDRRESGECSEWVIFEKLKVEEKEIKAHLAPHAKTRIEFTPIETGEFPFSCGMGMLHGKLVVVD